MKRWQLTYGDNSARSSVLECRKIRFAECSSFLIRQILSLLSKRKVSLSLSLPAIASGVELTIPPHCQMRSHFTLASCRRTKRRRFENIAKSTSLAPTRRRNLPRRTSLQTTLASTTSEETIYSSLAIISTTDTKSSTFSEKARSVKFCNVVITRQEIWLPSRSFETRNVSTIKLSSRSKFWKISSNGLVCFAFSRYLSWS